MSTFTDVRELGSRLQSYNFEVFKEPRGTIRIMQFVFASITALILRFYTGYIDIEYKLCKTPVNEHLRLEFEYPFNLDSVSGTVVCNSNQTIVVTLSNDYSSEAEFLFTICWVSVVFTLIMAFVYIKFREDYESNGNLALVDFLVSVLLAVLWIACFGAWGYGLSNMKGYTDPDNLKTHLNNCKDNLAVSIECVNVVRGSVTSLTVSLIFAFLDFFLWAAGLWFLYKETPWYLQFQRA